MLRRWQGLSLIVGMATAMFGLFMALCGNDLVAAAFTLATFALFTMASNAKYAMLGEPLLFSDLALIGALFRHPQFYLSAVPMWQRMLAGLIAAALIGVIGWLFVPALAPHVAGAVLLLVALAALTLSLRSRSLQGIASQPDAEADTKNFGLLPVLLLYWLRWRDSRDPPPCIEVERRRLTDHDGPAPQLIVIVQCESFADPQELFGADFADQALLLPGLSDARKAACQWGNLQVSGFGAYTMRTEYGVLFGRDDNALGFRRYDPLLTALGDASWAMPARLRPAGWRSLFLHPHDMRFYGRDQIMPNSGFAELVGESAFAAPLPGEGRYVTDAAVTDVIMERAAAALEPTMLYAVTIENHGPWSADGSPDLALVPGYLRLVQNSDRMLTSLTERLAQLAGETRRPAMLVFFGDHRPSIPGASIPGGDRHTPYVMLGIGADGQIIPGENRRKDLTPAQLHHAVLDAALGAPITPPAA